ncbi:MAG: hypothetical protein LUE98_16340 [Tannerellaceae bacterium]|nr:hypothetical protein [Tannerellaceae bacterium]
MRKKLVFLACLMGILSGCKSDDCDDVNGGSFNESYGLRLSYDIQQPTSQTTRDTASEAEETQIKSFYILFFENSSAGTGSFVEVMDVTAVADATLSTSGTLEIPFDEESLLDDDTDYKMILCVNMEDYLGFKGINDLREIFMGTTEKDALKNMLKVSGVVPGPQEQWDNSNSITNSKLPMSASLVKKANENDFFVGLVPAVVGFDVFCEVEGYTLLSASLWNGLRTTPLLNSVSNNYSGERTERFYGATANQTNGVAGVLYAFENYVSNSQQDDKVSTCLIVGLRKEDTGNVEYFRINANVSGSGQELKRNYLYTTIIKSISDTGAATEREAYENSVSLVYELSISPKYPDEISYMGGNF